MHLITIRLLPIFCSMFFTVFAISWERLHSYPDTVKIIYTATGLGVLDKSGVLKQLEVKMRIITWWSTLHSNLQSISSTSCATGYATWAVTRGGLLKFRESAKSGNVGKKGSSASSSITGSMTAKWTEAPKISHAFKQVAVGAFGAWGILRNGNIVWKTGMVYQRTGDWLEIEMLEGKKFVHISTGASCTIGVTNKMPNTQYIKITELSATTTTNNKSPTRQFTPTRQFKCVVVEVPFQFRWIDVCGTDDTKVAVDMQGHVLLQHGKSAGWVKCGGDEFLRCFVLSAETVFAVSKGFIYRMKIDAGDDLKKEGESRRDLERELNNDKSASSNMVKRRRDESSNDNYGVVSKINAAG